MADTIPSTCPRCASPMSATDAAGLCPRCLLAMNFQTRTMPTGGDAASSPPPSPAELAEKFPQFEILECLGRGGMGIVYKARQKALDRIVAIKILAGEWQDAPGFAERFEKEAKLLAKLNHPNIVTIHDFGNAGGLFHIVMEFIDGVNVRDLLRDGKMPAEQALAIVPPICDALQFAHDHGIVHRDIKPENILLDREGRVKIADFGIATLAGDAADRSGTPAYMAPEQEGHAARIDHRADIFALGVVLYEMLTGERPTTSPVAPSKRVMIDVRLDEVVLRALENTPELRFQSAVEFHTVLEQAVEAAVQNGPARTSAPPRAGLAESPRSPAVDSVPWTLARSLKLVTVPVAALAVIWYSGLFEAGAPLASQPEGIIYLNLIWTVGVVVALMLLAGKVFHRVRSRRAGKSGARDPDAAESPSAKGVSTLPGLLLHFAPALLLVVAWLSSGLEKGAVLILGVVVVAGLVLRALGPKKLARKAAVPLLVMATMAGGGLLVTMKRDKLGPMIEREVPAAGPGVACILDLESGELLEPPAPVAEVLAGQDGLLTPEAFAWMQEHGGDVYSRRGSLHFVGGHLYLDSRPGSPGARDLSAWRVNDLGSPVAANLGRTAQFQLGAHRFRTGAFAFVTRKGTRGALAASSIYDYPTDSFTGNKVAYRLEEPAKPRALPPGYHLGKIGGSSADGLQFRWALPYGELTPFLTAGSSGSSGEQGIWFLSEKIGDARDVVDARFIEREDGDTRLILKMRPGFAPEAENEMLGSDLVMLWKGRAIPNGRRVGMGAEPFDEPGISYRAGAIDPDEFLRHLAEARSRAGEPGEESDRAD